MSKSNSLRRCALNNNITNRRAVFAAASAAALALCPVASAFGQAIDGVVTPSDGYYLVDSQANTTQFGDQGSLANPISGSELDAMYAKVNADGSIQIALTGDMENNGNGLQIMVQNQLSGGAIVSTTSGPGSDNYGVVGQLTGSYNYAYGTYYTIPGSILSPGFNPNQSYAFNNSGGTMYVDAHDMNQVPGTAPVGQVANSNPDTYMGSAAVGSMDVAAVPSGTQTYGQYGTVTPLSFGTNGTINFAYDNSNVNGVTDTTVAAPGSTLIGDPLTATTGLELLISSLMLDADPTEPIRIEAHVTGSGGGEYLSNQFLPSLSSTYFSTNLGAGGPDYDARIDAANPLVDYETIPFLTWTSSSSGSYSTAGNWNFGVAPLGTNVTAQFSPPAPSVGPQVGPGLTVTLDQPVTLGGIVFNSTRNITISGTTTNNLTFATFGRLARINNATGANTLATPVVLGGASLDVTTAASTSLTFTGGVTNQNGTEGLITDGAGTVTLQGGTYNLASFQVNSGTLALSSATLTTNAPTQTSTVAIVHYDNGGTFTLDANSAIDVSKGGMVILYGNNPSPIGELSPNGHTQNYPAGSVHAYLQTAIDGGLWDNPGITSSAAENDPFGLTAVGALDQNDLLNATGSDYNGTTWMGTPITTDNAILVRYTYYGDADLDGSVGPSDVNNLELGFDGFGDGWVYGDFNYDGVVDGQDVNLLDLNYGDLPLGYIQALTSQQAAWLIANEKGLTPAQLSAFEARVGVPEPTSIALFGAATIGLLGRRRRRE